MRKRLTTFAGVIILTCGVIALAGVRHETQPGNQPVQQEDGRPRPPRPPRPDMLGHLAQELNLTDAQMAQIKAIMDAEHAAAEPNHKKFEELHAQLEAATANGQFDEAQVRAIANQQAQLNAESMVEHERAKSKIYNVLTVDQRTKMDEIHKHAPRPGGPGGPWGPREPGGPPPPPPPPDNE